MLIKNEDKRLSHFSLAGVNNTIRFNDSFSCFSQISLAVHGNGNQIIFKNIIMLPRGRIAVTINGNNNIIKIDDGVIINHNLSLSFFAGGLGSVADYCSIKIASNTFFNGSTNLICGEKNTNILIGADCLFANNIRLITTDNHSIYDISTLKRVNQAGDVKLGNHIWVCEDVTFLNNSSVADNCVIATKSLVTKHLTDENCVYGGIPAKKIKSNINWNRSLKDDFKESLLHKSIIATKESASQTQSERNPIKSISQLDKKFCVIVTIFNKQDYLKDCLYSVINQTYKNLQIILVDDGSTDNSLQIAKEFALKDDRIIIIRKKNGGAGNSRNAGIDFLTKKFSNFIKSDIKINGLNSFKCQDVDFEFLSYKNDLNFSKVDYLSFLDGDDSWDLQLVQKCIDGFLKDESVDIVWFQLGFLSKLAYENYSIVSATQWLMDIKNKEIQYIFASHSCALKFDYQSSIKVRFMENVYFEDHLFGMQIFTQARKICAITDILYLYKASKNSITRSSSVPRSLVKAFYENKGFDNILIQPFKELIARYPTKKLYDAISFIIIYEELLFFISNLKDDDIQILTKECFLKEGGYYAQEFFNRYSFIFRNYGVFLTDMCLVAKETLKLRGAKERVHRHLAYKLGSAMILNSKSLWGVIRMPYVLSYIKESHKKEIAEYQAKNSKESSLETSSFGILCRL